MSPFWREMSLCANGRMTHFVSLLPYFVPTAFGQSLTRTNSLSGRIRDCQVKNRAFMPLFLQRAPLWIVTPVPLFWLPCLLADTSNNPEIWPPSNLITAPATIDPAPRGFPSGDTSLSLSLLTHSLFLSLSLPSHQLPFSLTVTLCLSQLFWSSLFFSYFFSFPFLSERGDSVGTPVLIPSSLWICSWRP